MTAGPISPPINACETLIGKTVIGTDPDPQHGTCQGTEYEIVIAVHDPLINDPLLMVLLTPVRISRWQQS